jgi:hypothetical protein
MPLEFELQERREKLETAWPLDGLPPPPLAQAFAAPSFHYTVRSSCPLTTDGASRVRNGIRPHAVDLSANYDTHMTYIEQFEAELRKKYDEAQDEEVLFRWISEKVLEKLPQRDYRRPEGHAGHPQGAKPQARIPRRGPLVGGFDYHSSVYSHVIGTERPRTH